MTREELKEHCEKQVEMCEMWAKAKGEKPSGKVYEEHKLILELLEQEPCEDAISRQAVLDIAKSSKSNWIDNSVLFKRVNELSLVTPQPKMGHWIGIDEEPHEDYECDKCGYVVSAYTANIEPHTEYKYCPNCGAKMQEVEQ